MENNQVNGLKVYLVHCGFYDQEVCGGLYESHVNYFVVANSFDEARAKIKLNQEFKDKRMHVDGLQEIEAVNGYELNLKLNPALNGKDLIHSNKHRDLAPKPSPV